MRRMWGMVGLASLLGCVSDADADIAHLQILSAGVVGCEPSRIKIAEVRQFNQSIGWSAWCGQQNYICTTFSTLIGRSLVCKAKPPAGVAL